MVIDPEATATLFAMANALLKTLFTSSMEMVGGSPGSPVQVIVAGPPDVRFSGIVKVTAETKGRKRARLHKN
jgi:hypothetical protein